MPTISTLQTVSYFTTTTAHKFTVTNPKNLHQVNQIVIPDSLVPAVLRMVHDAVIAGHPGKERTLTEARAQYFWPTMRLDVDEHVAVLNVHSIRVLLLARHLFWSILHLTDHGTSFP